MAKAQADKNQAHQATLSHSPRDSRTATDDTWEAAKNAPKRYTRDVFLADLEIASRRITDEINKDPKEAEKLRRSLKQAKDGKTTAWKDADEDT